MKKILVFCLLLAFAAACKKKDPAPSNNNKTCRLQSVTDSGIVLATYEWGTNGKLSKIMDASGTATVYYYSGNKLDSTVDIFSGGDRFSETYTYKGDSVTIRESSGDNWYVIHYASGAPIRQNAYGIWQNKATRTMIEEYTVDGNGDIITTKQTIFSPSGTETHTIQHKYDSHPNPLYDKDNVTPDNCPNNAIESQEEGKPAITAVYEYSDKGLPTKRTYFNGNTKVNEEVLQYNCK